MTLEIFTLCDAATVHAGKMNILGSFDTLSSTSFPSHHSDCVVACKMRTVAEDDGPVDIEMHIIDPDGKDVIPPVSNRLDAGSHLHHHLWHIRGFPLSKPGVFYVDLLANGVLVGRNPLFVRESESRGGGHP